MEAINKLVQGKTDTELLEAMVTCIADNDQGLIGLLMGSINVRDARTAANIQVLAAIVQAVQSRTPMPKTMSEE